MASSGGEQTVDGDTPTIEFRVTPEFKETIEDLAWNKRKSKSEIMRAAVRYGVDDIEAEIDDILANDCGGVRPGGGTDE